jgi:hypothetical protein
MRGLSLSTAGTTPVTFLFGQLDPTSRQPASSNAPGVVALAMGVTSSKELSVTPRALVPVGSQTAQSSVGTAIRADVSRHVSFVSDVGAAGTTQRGWDPLAAAGVVGHWSGAEIETNLLRGTSPVSTSNVATVGSLDREIVRGLVRSIPGMTISTQASWSRPASAPTSTDTAASAIGVAYDRLPIGVLTATRQDEDSSWQQTATTSIEWRRKPVGGIVVRYSEREQALRDGVQPTMMSKQVELELPGWIERDFRNRLDVHAVLTDSPMLGTPTVSSKLSARFGIIGDVGVTGDTEIGMSRGGPTVRELRVASKVPGSGAHSRATRLHVSRSRTVLVVGEPIVRSASSALGSNRELVISPKTDQAMRTSRARRAADGPDLVPPEDHLRRGTINRLCYRRPLRNACS